MSKNTYNVQQENVTGVCRFNWKLFFSVNNWMNDKIVFSLAGQTLFLHDNTAKKIFQYLTLTNNR